jgi:outer membrane protein OmpA-like peptidoglycan-associated protein
MIAGNQPRSFGRIRAFALGTAILAIAVSPGSARADGYDAQLYRPATSSAGYFSTQGGEVLESGTLEVGASVDYATDVVIARDPDTGDPLMNGEIVKSRFGGTVLAGLGLGFLEVGVAVPFVMGQDGDIGRLMPNETLADTVLGDIRAFAKVRLVRSGSLRLALGVDATAPTGIPEDFSGSEGVTVRPMVLVGTSSERFRAALNVGYRIRDRVQIANLAIDDEITANLGLALAAAPGRIWLIAEAYASKVVDGEDNDMPAEAIGGARFILGDRAYAQAGFGVGLTQGYATPGFRGLLSVTVAAMAPERAAPIPPDTDGDGMIDTADNCPADREDMDGWEDTDGCPDRDDDGDGVLDDVDECKREAGVIENKGCPDKDGDLDGLVGRLDRCPADPEDKDEYEDTDGCPDTDDDKDGIADPADVCKRVAEDLDGFQDEDGCPETDNDQDGFADEADKCPNEAEVFNGKDDDDGCPDKGDVLVKVTSDKIEITEQVFFETNKAKIKKRSFTLLATVAKILTLHPEIKKVRVEGHTDSKGKREKNMKLSQARADSVMKHLVEVNGIDPARLEAVGKGPDEPIEDNKTSKGRAKNRRVEFDIVELEGQTGAAPEPPPAPASPPPTASPPTTDTPPTMPQPTDELK